jgi:hypothetical protein
VCACLLVCKNYINNLSGTSHLGILRNILTFPTIRPSNLFRFRIRKYEPTDILVCRLGREVGPSPSALHTQQNAAEGGHTFLVRIRGPIILFTGVIPVDNSAEGELSYHYFPTFPPYSFPIQFIYPFCRYFSVPFSLLSLYVKAIQLTVTL